MPHSSNRLCKTDCPMSASRQDDHLNYSAYQKAFWEAKRARRRPTHPVVRAFSLPKVNFIVSQLAGTGARTLLDVGAGNGFFSYYFAECFEVSSLDFSLWMLKNNPCTRRLGASAEALPFRDGSFDVVFCGGLLHHLEAPELAVREMARVAKRFVVLCEPNRANPGLAAFMLVRKEERRGLKFTLRYLGKLAASAGLKVLKAVTTGAILPNRMPAVLLPVLKRLDRPHPLATTHIIIAEKVGRT